VASRWRSGGDESRRGPSSAQRARLARDDDENRSGRQRRLQRQLQRQLKRRLKRQLQPNCNGNCSHPSQRTRRVGHPEHRRVTATAKAKAKQTQKQKQSKRKSKRKRKRKRLARLNVAGRKYFLPGGASRGKCCGRRQSGGRATALSRFLTEQSRQNVEAELEGFLRGREEPGWRGRDDAD
jgi:hypothetical protein